MSEILTPDICVVGAGSAGLTVAAAAAAFGVPVVLVEKGRMGGDCLNYGCVPSKALLAAGRRAEAIRRAPDFGVRAGGEVGVDMRAVNAHVRSVIAAIEPNDSEERFTALGVRVVRAAGRFVDRRTLEAGEWRIRARRFVVAAGSSPLVPPVPGLDEIDYFTSETIFDNRRRLAHLVIIGGGPIGLEMAQAHRRLGSRVTVVEAGKALAGDDPELTSILLERLRREDIAILEQTAVEAVERRGKTGVRLRLRGAAGETALDGSDILVAAGRRASVEGLGLEAAGVRHDGGGIAVDAALRTSNRRIYAIGDVAGAPRYTHLAGYHGGLVVRSILFRQRARPDLSIVPHVTFTDPELAHVGLTEAAARAAHRQLRVLRWPYHENDRAQAERETGGEIKVIADRKGRILGATIVGAAAGEMISLWALALSKKLALRDIAGFVAPYPTLSEIGRRAAIAYYAPLAGRPFVRTIVNFLRKFG